MRIFFSVGEPSGDLHASNLIRRLKQIRPDCHCVGFGGPKMQIAGCDVLFDLTQLAVMFVSGVFKNFRRFIGLIRQADQYFVQHDVDAVVLIDYPGLNWWIARKAKKRGIPVFYYGVPQMWAWAPWRIRKLKRLVDHVLCKLPFEEDWFRQRDCDAYYVGHPYFDQLHSQNLDLELVRRLQSDQRPALLLLPGSRDFEVESNVNSLISIAEKVSRQCATIRVVVGCFNARHAEIVKTNDHSSLCEVFVGQTQELMTAATACVACSGSVTLELLYHRLPTVIVYKISSLKLWLSRWVLRCRFISLPNLMSVESIEGRAETVATSSDDGGNAEVPMPEFLTDRDCSEFAASHVVRWMSSTDKHHQQWQILDNLATDYAQPGATARAAEYIMQKLSDNGAMDRSSVAA